MNIVPLGDRVLIRTLDEEEKAGSIIIPDTAKEKPQRGEVMAVGPGRLGKDGKRLDMEVSQGDKVLFGKWSGTEVSMDGEKYLVMCESDLLAIL